MYIWDFSRSDGAGSATTRKTRGLTRSVMALIVPPLPAPSRPSNTRMTRRPLYFTQSWSLQSWTWSLRSSFSYSLLPIFAFTGASDSFGCFIRRARQAANERIPPMVLIPANRGRLLFFGPMLPLQWWTMSSFGVLAGQASDERGQGRDARQ